MNGAASSSNPPPPAPASLLAPGFRFHPTDEELVSYYLKGKVSGRPLFDAIAEIDLYKSEPWDLPAMSHLRSRDLEWYFFSPLDRKYANRSRTNRATMQGYWKTTGKDRPIQRGSRTVGMKKTLVFHAGRAPNGKRTNWVMHEYRLEDQELANANIPQDGYVVCRIFQKKAAGPQNGAQYGAPFVEEEWEEAGEFVTTIEGGGGVVTTAAEYLQVSDFEQNQDQGNQPESTIGLAASPDVLNSDIHPEDPFSLEEMFQDPSFINGIPQLQDTPTNPDDGYMELNDLLNPVDEDHHSSEYPILGASMSSIVGDEEIDLPVEDFFTATNENTYLEPNDVLNPMAGEFVSDQTAEDNSTFYDAPGFDLSFNQENFVQMNDLPYSPVDDSSGFKSVDDIMAYFDSTENNLQYSTLPEEFSFSPEVDAVASSSARFPTSENIIPEPEAGKRKGIVGAGVRRAVMGRIENMLGSITAPPANAELVSASSAKSLGLMTTPSSVRVTAGMIEIRGFKVMGRAEHWSMDKSGDTRFLLSCGVSNPGGFEPVTKIQGWTMSVAVLLRGGFYFFFLSAMLLALCLKIGMRVCSR